MEYYIFTTNDCNLNCKYCSVLLKNKEHNIPDTPTYSLDQLNKFINDTQLKYKDDCAEIVFFGGEPTLNYEFIHNLIELQKNIQNIPYSFKYVLHTNGLLLGNISDEILFDIDAIMLSINYDMIPRYQLNEGYFKTLTDAVNTIKRKKNVPVIGRLTITENTSLYSEISMFHIIFDAIYWQIENCYQFNNFERFYNSYNYEIEMAFKLWIDFIQRGIVLNFIPFIAASKFSIEKESSDSFCCGYNKSIVFIQTNGVCYTCAEDMTTQRNVVGNIFDGIQFETFTLNDTECLFCDFAHVCKGRCGRMHREFNKQHIKEYCKLNQILFNLISDNFPIILSSIKKFNLDFSMNNPIYHYTEYTP